MAQHRTTLSLRGTLILCALSGVLLSLCFPPAGLSFLAWVALVPWLVALRRARAWAALLGSWVGGIVFFGALCYWLYLFGISVLVIAAALLGLWLVIWAAAMRMTGRLGPAPRMFAAPVLWCGVEWLRGLGAFGFTWGWLGYSQAVQPAVLPVARICGTLGISFVIALANAAICELASVEARGAPMVRSLGRALFGLVATATCLLGARAWVIAHPLPAGPQIRVAVIQGSAHGPLRARDVNVPLSQQQQRDTLDIYAALTAQAASRRPALVVWPESVLASSPESQPWIASRVSQIAHDSNGWLLAGGPYYDERGRIYNSAYLYSPTGNLTARYDKVQLVPFGEYVPGRSRLPFLERYHVRAIDFSAGAVHRMLQAGTIAAGPMICFESIFPQIAWQLVDRGAQVLVVITNDAWFGHTAAASQHEQIARLRAVETGRWVLRAASTGVSSIIAPNGRTAAQAQMFRRETLSATITLAPPNQSLPARTGPVFPWLVVGLSVAYVIAPAAVPRSRARTRAARPSGGPRQRGKTVPQ